MRESLDAQQHTSLLCSLQKKKKKKKKKKKSHQCALRTATDVEPVLVGGGELLEGCGLGKVNPRGGLDLRQSQKKGGGEKREREEEGEGQINSTLFDGRVSVNW